MAKFKLGRNFKLYTSDTLLDGSTNTPSSVSWTEAANVKDVTLNQSATQVDVTTRAAGGRKQTAQGLKDASIEFEMPWRPDAADFQSFRDSYNSGGAVGVAVVDGDIETVGTQGLVANAVVTQFNNGQPLDGEATVNVRLDPQSQEDWHEVTV